MKPYVLALALALTWPVAALAEYTTPTIAAVDPADDAGRVHVVVVFSGVDVKDVKREYYPDTLTAFSAAVYADLAALNRQTTATKPLQVGAIVPPPAPVTPPDTEDDAAASAFTQAFATWRSAVIRGSVGAAPQPEVDLALAAWVALYDDAKTAPLRARLAMIIATLGKVLP